VPSTTKDSREAFLTNAYRVGPVLGIGQVARGRQGLRVKRGLPSGVYVARGFGLLVGVHFASTFQLQRMHNTMTAQVGAFFTIG